jgi:peptide chain release factor subunit 1
VSNFFELIAKETGTYCYGVEDTLNALEMSAVKTLIIYENLTIDRIELEHPVSNEINVHFIKKGDESKKNIYVDKETGLDMKEVSRVPLVEWFADNYKKHGATLEFITDKSQEGNQFCKGFGGVGAVLQWKLDMSSLEPNFKEEDDMDVDDFDFDEYDAAMDYEDDFI